MRTRHQAEHDLFGKTMVSANGLISWLIEPMIAHWSIGTTVGGQSSDHTSHRKSGANDYQCHNRALSIFDSLTLWPSKGGGGWRVMAMDGNGSESID